MQVVTVATTHRRLVDLISATTSNGAILCLAVGLVFRAAKPWTVHRIGNFKLVPPRLVGRTMNTRPIFIRCVELSRFGAVMLARKLVSLGIVFCSTQLVEAPSAFSARLIWIEPRQLSLPILFRARQLSVPGRGTFRLVRKRIRN